jgi:hypothetical protein
LASYLQIKLLTSDVAQLTGPFGKHRQELHGDAGCHMPIENINGAQYAAQRLWAGDRGTMRSGPNDQRQLTDRPLRRRGPIGLSPVSQTDSRQSLKVILSRRYGT